jgi:hypothetical protein
MHDFMQNSLTDGDKLTKCELSLALEGGSTNGYDNSKFIQWCCKLYKCYMPTRTEEIFNMLNEQVVYHGPSNSDHFEGKMT